MESSALCNDNFCQFVRLCDSVFKRVNTGMAKEGEGRLCVERCCRLFSSFSLFNRTKQWMKMSLSHHFPHILILSTVLEPHAFTQVLYFVTLWLLYTLWQLLHLVLSIHVTNGSLQCVVRTLTNDDMIRMLWITSTLCQTQKFSYEATCRLCITVYLSLLRLCAAVRLVFRECYYGLRGILM